MRGKVTRAITWRKVFPEGDKMDRKGGGKPTLFSYFKPTQTPPAKKKPPTRNALREQGNEGPSSVRVEAKTTPTRLKPLQSLDDDDSEDEIGKPKVRGL